MIQVQVTLLSKFAIYKTKLNNGQLSVPINSTILEVAEILGIPAKFVIIVLKNGKQASPIASLSDGDQLVFVPPAVGGG